jgi:hypothetical protein
MNLSSINIYWFLLPLILAISLVYAASRHEDWRRIWRHSLRSCVTILLILIAATVLLSLLNNFT